MISRGRRFVALLLAGAMLWGCSESAADSEAENRKAVEEITAIEKEMAAAQGAEGVTRTWSDDMVWYEIGPVEIHGGKPATALTAQQFKALGQLRTKILRIEVNANGNIGYAHSIQNFIADRADGGGELNFIFRETDIFEKRDGKWQLVHQHLSVPVDLATGKAVISPRDLLEYPFSVKPKS